MQLQHIIGAKLVIMGYKFRPTRENALNTSHPTQTDATLAFTLIHGLPVYADKETVLCLHCCQYTLPGRFSNEVGSVIMASACSAILTASPRLHGQYPAKSKQTHRRPDGTPYCLRALDNSVVEQLLSMLRTIFVNDAPFTTTLGISTRPFMIRFADFLHALCALLCLLIGINLKDPHLLSIRTYASPLLVLFALTGLLMVIHHQCGRRWLAPLLIAWLTLLGTVSYQEYEFHTQKQAVQIATGDDAYQFAMLGRHLIVGYDEPGDIRELARRGFIAGLFVSRRNVEGKTFEELRAELADLQSLRRQAGLPPLIISSDQEGGPVSRLSPPLSRQPALSSLLMPGLSNLQIEQHAFAYGAKQANALAALGVNLNFSPVVDLKPERSSGALDFHTRILERAISADPETVTRVALAYSRGLLSQGVIPTVKHFPGLGNVAGDTHHFSARLELPLHELNARDWYPFRQVLSQVPALLMIGHVVVDEVDSKLPASLSEKVITGIVRKNWKYDGVVISDDMTMAAVYDRGLCRSSVKSLNAGLDLLLLAYDWEKVYPVLDCLRQASKSGRLLSLDASRARLDQLSWLIDKEVNN